MADVRASKNPNFKVTVFEDAVKDYYVLVKHSQKTAYEIAMRKSPIIFNGEDVTKYTQKLVPYNKDLENSTIHIKDYTGVPSHLLKPHTKELLKGFQRKGVMDLTSYINRQKGEDWEREDDNFVGEGLKLTLTGIILKEEKIKKQVND